MAIAVRSPQSRFTAERYHANVVSIHLFFLGHHWFLMPPIWRRWVQRNDLQSHRSFIDYIVPSVSLQVVLCPLLGYSSIVVVVCLVSSSFQSCMQCQLSFFSVRPNHGVRRGGEGSIFPLNFFTKCTYHLSFYLVFNNKWL